MEQKSLEQRIASTLRSLEYSELPFIVAVSGGKDSMTLLHALVQLNIAPLVVAHFDHGLRTESQADASFVSDVAASYGLPYVSERAQKKPETGESTEEWARRVRYAFLRRVQDESGAVWILTAHTADDQAETVILALTRGTGLTGVSGMMSVQGDIVRPLLTTNRQEIDAYVVSHSLPYHHDSSNDDRSFSRNRVRQEVMPELSLINSEVVSNITRFGMIARDTAQFLRESASKWCGLHGTHDQLDRAAFVVEHPVLQREILRAMYHALHGSYIGCTYDTIERAREWICASLPGTQVPFGAGGTAHHDYEIISFELKTDETFPSVDLSVPGSVTWGNVRITAAPCDKILYTPATAVIDTRRSGSKLSVRSYRPGDRFVPSRSTHSKKLSDFLSGARVPARQRHSVPIITASDGAIVWVGGYRISEHYRALESTPHTQRISLSIS